MKKLSILILLLNFSLNAQEPEAQWINPNPVPYFLYDIFFLDSLQGWAVGENSTAIKTTNGGESWEQLKIPIHAELQRVYFADANNGWITGGNPSVPLHGALLKTTNGGESWINYQPNTSQSYAFLDISMPTNEIGYVSGFEGIFKTTNGGTSWTNTEGVNWATSVYFLDPLRGWATGVQDVIRTTDGAKTWNKIREFHWAFNKRIKFLNEKTGWVVGGGLYEIYGTIKKTTDGGLNWFLQDSTNVGENYDLEIIDSLNVIVIGDKGQIKYTTDGGENWYSSIANSASYNYGLSVVNNSAWLVGGSYHNPKIFKANSNYLNWQTQVKVITQNDLFDIDFIDKNNGWAAGLNGDLLYTTDGGEYWYRKELFNINFRSISTPVEDVIFAGGINGEFISSFDGGNTWEVKEIIKDYYGEDHKIKFFSETTGFSLQNWNPLMKTTDGGSSWDTIFAYANDFFFVDSLIGWIYYEPQIIWKNNNSNEELAYLRKTTDGGLTWSEEININTMTSIFFIDSQTGWYSDRIYLYKTVDGGFTWEKINDSALYSFLQINFINENEGYFLGSSNTGYKGVVVLKTNDGGKSFVPLKEYTELNKFVLTTKELIGVGSYGQIFKMNRILTDIKLEPKNIVSEFSLSQNYPNPFNPSTIIRYSVSNNELTIIKIYDILGNEITTLVNEEKSPGEYEITFDANRYSLSSGVYFYKIQAGNFIETKKFVLIK